MKRKSLPTGRDFLFVEGYGNENPGAFQSPRPLRGATIDVQLVRLRPKIFQPTRPLRGATLFEEKRDNITDIISTHAPLAGRDHSFIMRAYALNDFNPRAPCGARLHIAQHLRSINNEFQPTRPLRGATCAG